MTTLVLLHSALGKTPGMEAIAGRYTAAGHTVVTPDFYEGRTFTTAEAGVGHSQEVGFSQLVDRVAAACADLPDEIVFAGLSLGAGIAQQMGKNDSRARGALLFHGGGFPKPTRWQGNVPVQIHFSVDDEWRDSGAPQTLMESAARAGARAEYFLYPGGSHLFSDPLVDDYREDSAQLLLDRSLAFLDRV
ncbi:MULTISPECIES: dienelactone hydrolase family protein [unclassified Brevibacterium]|uniref:dienelactone hydrolase family protein n=1 Tax=unclassified Brevibacterium TaxID=2614124 RepID=UPI000C5F7A1A|nr:MULTISPECIES: dienelactone hydrolase family protein [unclassified Brevibacterium]SMX82685.1 Dienelactone hydrolase [Brevibacterium sp. 239c]